jgi:hypothetical protein
MLMNFPKTVLINNTARDDINAAETIATVFRFLGKLTEIIEIIKVLKISKLMPRFSSQKKK